MTEARPPYRAAVLVSLAVLAGYLLTLAPSVTFWDAGEFIAAAHSLGIPHPPGTPLFVLVAHVWGMLVPFGEYAWRLNLLSALCGAIAAGAWFLVAHATLLRLHADLDARPRALFAMLGGGAAALLSAFSFTMWQNAVETEVYSVATLTIALVAWLATRWRAQRTSARGTRLLLVMLYLGAISIGNHLLALLVGPAVVALLAVTAREAPLDAEARVAEWARIAVFAAVWVLLIGLGLGSVPLLALGGVLVLVAARRAARTGQLAFVATALVIAIVGITPYLFLLFRARQGPWLNEVAPTTWDAVLGVIRRAQYPPRTPLDDPTLLHGPDNPGRTFTLFAYQLANYVQYFDWQWARSIGIVTAPSVGRLVVTLCMFWFGLRGAVAQWRRDRAGFALVGALWLITGLGLVVYMNFKPGSTVGWDRWTDGHDHEVRERDYFFVASFVAWGVWAAFGLTDLVRALMARVRAPSRRLLLGGFALALVPIALNWRAATRASGPERTFARDVARAMLQSAPPRAILFTWGDNDTFPLWYVQAVEGVRRDVTVVCLALAETPWYLRQMRDRVAEPVDPATLAAVWRDAAPIDVRWPVHEMSDAMIDAFVPLRTDRPMTMPLGDGSTLSLPAGSVLSGKDLMVLQILRQNAGRRPVSWSVTAAGKIYDLGPRLVQTGLVLTLGGPRASGSADIVGGQAAGPGGAGFDMTTTARLMHESWDFGTLFTDDLAKLDANIAGMVGTVALPHAQLGIALVARGDTARAIPVLETAVHLAPQPQLEAALAELKRAARR